jgi:hypothetical protein
LLPAAGAVPAIPRRVTVANVDPQRAVVSEHTFDFTKDRDQSLDVFFRRFFQSDLPVNSNCSALSTDITERFIPICAFHKNGSSVSTTVLSLFLMMVLLQVITIRITTFPFDSNGSALITVFTKRRTITSGFHTRRNITSESVESVSQSSHSTNWLSLVVATCITTLPFPSSVVARSVVRRRRDAAVDAFSGQSLEHFQGISAQHREAGGEPIGVAAGLVPKCVLPTHEWLQSKRQWPGVS